MSFAENTFLEHWRTLGLNKNRNTLTIAANAANLGRKAQIEILNSLIPLLNRITMLNRLSNISLNKLIPGGERKNVGAGTEKELDMLYTRIINGIDALAINVVSPGVTTPTRSDKDLPLPGSPQSGGRRKRSRKSPTRKFRKRSRSTRRSR